MIERSGTFIIKGKWPDISRILKAMIAAEERKDKGRGE